MDNALFDGVFASFGIQATKGEAEFLLDLGEHGDEVRLPGGFATFVVESDHGTIS
jgi:hypothetical protein